MHDQAMHATNVELVGSDFKQHPNPQMLLNDRVLTGVFDSFFFLRSLIFNQHDVAHWVPQMVCRCAMDIGKVYGGVSPPFPPAA